MAKGIYKKPNGKYSAVTWDEDGKLKYHGTHKTKKLAKKARKDAIIAAKLIANMEPLAERYKIPESTPVETPKVELEWYQGEAGLDAIFADKSTHHWMGLPAEPERYGFIYKIVDLNTEELYIGRKVYRYYNRQTSQRDIPSDWEFYVSSSKYVQEAIEKGHDMTYEIIANLDTNDESSLMEHQLISMYFMRKLASGKRMLINKMCPKLFSNGIEDAMDVVNPLMDKIIGDMP